jgi:hypothetical protein
MRVLGERPLAAVSGRIFDIKEKPSMNTAQIRDALLWCVIRNIGLVTVWSILGLRRDD